MALWVTKGFCTTTTARLLSTRLSSTLIAASKTTNTNSAAVVASTATITCVLLLSVASAADNNNNNYSTATTTTLCDDSSPQSPTLRTNGFGNDNGGTSSRSKLIFLGTGSSTGCPRPLCTMLFGSSDANSNNNGITALRPGEDDPKTTAAADAADTSSSTKWLQEQLKYCQVSNMAIQGNPKENRDYRNNPSLLISYCDNHRNNNTNEHNDGKVNDDNATTTSSPSCQNIIIDVGKTFREGALRWFPENGISSLDAIVLTHHHMDAVGGLDDVRGFQRVGFPPPTTTTTTTKLQNSSALPVHLQPTQLPPPSRVSIPVFLSQECLDQVSSQFPWLFPKQQQRSSSSSSSTTTNNNKESKPVVPRDVAALDVRVIHESLKSFEVVEGFKMTALPVWHGDDLISLGFAFSIPSSTTNASSSSATPCTTSTATNVVYISDISRMIPETLDYIMTQLPQPTHVLIVDALLTGNRTHPVHFNLEQAVELIQTIQPPASPNHKHNNQQQHAYLVGMSCDSFLPHELMNQTLRDKYNNSNIQLAHDGLVIDL